MSLLDPFELEFIKNNPELEDWIEHFYRYVSLGEGYKRDKSEMIFDLIEIMKKLNN